MTAQGAGFKFTTALADLCRESGEVFRFGETVDAIDVDGDRISGVSTSKGHLQAAHYVVALGSASTTLLRRIGIKIPVYPVKGYSLTIDIKGWNNAPTVPLLDDGKLIGTDGELMVLIAERLGPEVDPQLMDWSAEIQSTKQGKVDIMHGAMGWIEVRSKIMLLTDPIYYFGTLVAQKTENNWNTFEDMKGCSVATVSGFTLVPELKGVDGIGEVKLYDTTDGALRDLIAGRVDMAILDPPLMQLAINENPDWNLHQVELQPEPDTYLIMSQKYNVIFGINSELTELHDAVNQKSARSGRTAPMS